MSKVSSKLLPVLGAGLLLAPGCADDGQGGGEAGTSGVARAGSGSGNGGSSGGGRAGTASGGAAGGGAAGGGGSGRAGGGASGEGGEGSGGDAGRTQGGAAGDGDTPSAGAGGEAGNAGAACAVGRSVTSVFDETGGSLALCGAELEMPAGILGEPRSVTLSLVELPPSAPAWLAVAGAAFEVDVEGDLPVAAGAPLSVTVPHAETSRYVYLYVHSADTWNYVEACTRENDHIGQEVWTEGVFVALVEKEDFPESTRGLGSGSVSVDFDGVVSTFDLDAETIETHAIFDSNEEGRSVTLSATKQADDSSLERLRIDFGIELDGNATLIQVTYGSTADVNGFWSYLPFHPGMAEVQLTRDEGGELGGMVSAPLTQGEVVSPFAASFDVLVEKFRYPPEGYCNLPEGDALDTNDSEIWGR